MKNLQPLKIILTTLILSLFLCSYITTCSAFASSNDLIINTSNNILGKVYYDNFSIIAKKITSTDGIGYCLEIDKNYPNGENFINKSTVTTAITNILTCGYPNKSASDLNLTSDDDAYFATQIAIWSSTGGYDVSKITGDRPEILTAIRTIYNNSLTVENDTSNYDINLFFTDSSIQNVAILSIKLSPMPPISSIEESIFPQGK